MSNEVESSYNEQEGCWEGKPRLWDKETGEWGGLIDKPEETGYEVEVGDRIRIWSSNGTLQNDTYITEVGSLNKSTKSGDPFIVVRLRDTSRGKGSKSAPGPKFKPKPKPKPSGGQTPPAPEPPPAVEILEAVKNMQSTLDQILYHLTMKED